MKFLLVLMLLAGVAHAETDDRSEVTAGALAVGGSLVGPALITLAFEEGNQAGTPLHDQFWQLMAGGGAAILIGPSLGNWYAGQLDSTGLNLRLGGGLAVGVGVALVASGFSFGDGGNDGEVLLGGLIGLAGAGMVAAGTVLDVINAPMAVARRHHVAIAPMISPRQTGLALAGTF